MALGGGDLGWTAVPSGKYVASVTVDGGEVIVTYGVNANTNLGTTDVVLHAGATTNGDIVWVCQDGDAITGATMATAVAPANATPGKYLPSTCRP